MLSVHYQNDRQTREALIRNEIGYGVKVAEFIVDRGHPNGPERHELTTTGIINIYNARTNKLVTKLIANPNQVRRYYEAEGRTAPEDILRLAYEHKRKGYNEVK